jgi:hypothetical protein
MGELQNVPHGLALEICPSGVLCRPQHDALHRPTAVGDEWNVRALRRSTLLHELEFFMPTTLSDEQPLRRALMAAAET